MPHHEPQTYGSCSIDVGASLTHDDSDVGSLFSSFFVCTVAIVMNKIQFVSGHDQVHGGSLLLCIFLTAGYKNQHHYHVYEGVHVCVCICVSIWIFHEAFGLKEGLFVPRNSWGSGSEYYESSCKKRNKTKPKPGRVFEMT